MEISVMNGYQVLSGSSNLRTICGYLRPTTPLRLAEAPASYHAKSAPVEADLWRIWEGQRFPKGALVTGDGQPLRVIYRGRPGRGPGPDFRDAIIAAPDGLLQGDVELHVRTSDFRRHGHHLDPAYAGVALHVVLFHDETGETSLPAGGSAPVAALGGPRLSRWLEQAPRWGEPCRSAVPRLGAGEVALTLERLGGMRFRQKAAAAGKCLAAGARADEVLWQGLLEALAYGGDRPAFARLAVDVPWQGLRAAVLDGQPAFAILTRAFAPHDVRGGVRPSNRAGVRLQAAAALAERFAGPGLAASLIGPLAEPEGAAHAIITALTMPKLVGRSRAIEIAANAVLPLAAALCADAGAISIERVFAALPLPARYGAVRHLHEAAAGLGLDTRRQQGMLYLLRQYCTQGGCGKCPLS